MVTRGVRSVHTLNVSIMSDLEPIRSHACAVLQPTNPPGALEGQSALAGSTADDRKGPASVRWRVPVRLTGPCKRGLALEGAGGVGGL